MDNLKWIIINKINNPKPKNKVDEIKNVLLENRGMMTKKQKEEFFNPTHPEALELKNLGIRMAGLKKALTRIAKAVKDKEQIIIYGDYDADGICATAVLWEILYFLNKNTHPYIPDRFEEGYGLNVNSVLKLKTEYPELKLIITTDNGIVAHEAVEDAKKFGIDVIVTDHHQPLAEQITRKGFKSFRGKNTVKKTVKYSYPDACAIVHTTKLSGSCVAWILARELGKKFKNTKLELQIQNDLELAAIGAIADQVPLLGVNRSFAKFGLDSLKETKRPGLIALFNESGLAQTVGGVRGRWNIGMYEVNYIIVPRINAMGRMEHAIDSLRLLCTRSNIKARELASVLGQANLKRKKLVEKVVFHAREIVEKQIWKGAIIVDNETYHEGVIGLAASKIVEEFGRPTIVFSKGKKISKASARSVSGFNINESIRRLSDITLGGGGHSMAAGFSIETDKIELFKEKFDQIVTPLLTDELLERKLKIDVELDLTDLSLEFFEIIEKFEPCGVGNPAPIFLTKNVNVYGLRTVGAGGKHLKLVIEKDGKTFEAIAFGKGDYMPVLNGKGKINIAYNLYKNTWNGKSDIQLRIRDIKSGE